MAHFPTIAEAARRLPVTTAMIHGEAVVENANAVPDFSALQAAIGAREGPGDKPAHKARTITSFCALVPTGRSSPPSQWSGRS